MTKQLKYWNVINSEFKKKLDDFEKGITQRFYEKQNLLIGLSIQIMRERQDKHSSTRVSREPQSPSHQNINSYCKKRQGESLAKCNMFDYVTKKYINDFKQNQGEMLCSCYANVTNYVIPYKLQNSNEPWFYIFFGQFLLSQIPQELSLLEKRNIYKLEYAKVPKEQEELKDYAKEFEIQNDNSMFLVKDNNSPEISVVDYTTLEDFKELVLREFEKFIMNFFIKDGSGMLVPNQELQDFLQETSTNDLIPNIDTCASKLKKYKSIRKDSRDKGLELLNEIKRLMVEKGDEVNNNAVLLKKIRTLTNAYKQGSVGRKKWFSEGEKIKKLIQDL